MNFLTKKLYRSIVNLEPIVNIISFDFNGWWQLMGFWVPDIEYCLKLHVCLVKHIKLNTWNIKKEKQETIIYLIVNDEHVSCRG